MICETGGQCLAIVTGPRLLRDRVSHAHDLNICDVWGVHCVGKARVVHEIYGGSVSTIGWEQ